MFCWVQEREGMSEIRASSSQKRRAVDVSGVVYRSGRDATGSPTIFRCSALNEPNGPSPGAEFWALLRLRHAFNLPLRLHSELIP